MIDFIKIKAKLISALGIPYYENDNCILFCGDTIQLQKNITDHYFDAVITSPPYNIGKEYENVKPLGEYIEWLSEWINDSSKV